MRVACRLSAEILAEVAAQVRPGTTTGELDAFAAGADEGAGREERVLWIWRISGVHVHLPQRGGGARDSRAARDQRRRLVSVDLGVVAEGFIGDNATTVRVGAVDAESVRLCEVCEAALAAGIDAARAGAGWATSATRCRRSPRRPGFSVVRDFCGHGVGRKLHEDPQIPNFGPPGKGRC
jgi:methionyl aminopeptidase